MKNTPAVNDLAIHAVLFLAAVGVLLLGGVWQSGATPPLIYPLFFILATLTLYRQHALQSPHHSPIVLIPSLIGAAVIAFCLINEMHRDFWAFSSPRQYPVLLRVLWYHAFFLLIHPAIYPLVWEGAALLYRALRARGYFHSKVWITAAIAAMVLWFVRSQNLSPDGYDWLKHSVLPKSWAGYLREPMGMMIFRVIVWCGQKILALAPYSTLTLLTLFCGFLTTWLLRPVIKNTLPHEYWGLAMLFLFGCAGYTQVFVGNIEIYCLLHVFLALYLWASWRYCQGALSAWVPGLLFALLFCVHLSAGWWIPTLLTLPLLKQWQFQDVKNLAAELFQMLAAASAFILLYWTFLLFYNYAGSPARMWEHFFSDEVMLVGSDAAMFNPLTTYIDPAFYIRMFNEYFFIIPGTVILPVIIGAAFRRWSPLSPQTLWYGLFVLFYLIYTLVWRPDRKFPADWDIFSGLTIPAALLLCQLTVELKLPSAAKRYALYQTVIFGLMFVLWTLVRNHQKATDWPVL